jgi:hypothetical protein
MYSLISLLLRCTRQDNILIQTIAYHFKKKFTHQFLGIVLPQDTLSNHCSGRQLWTSHIINLPNSRPQDLGYHLELA